MSADIAPCSPRIHDARLDWQRRATRELATGRTAEAIHTYRDHGAVHVATTRDEARADLIDRWDRDRQAQPDATRIILTHTNDEVRVLNLAARERLRRADELGDEVTLQVEKGNRDFAVGNRVMFGRNERSLGVKNGSLGRIESLSAVRMAVMLDDGRAVAFDLKDYAAVDHGYAATIHKSQGVTVDRVHVLATPGLDRHAAYVALSRHRDAVDLHYARDDFADDGKLIRTLSRERAKDMASDYRQVFANRRQIILPVTPAPERSEVIDRSLPSQSAPAFTSRSASLPKIAAALPKAVERHGRIVHAIRFAQSVGEPYTADQRLELAASRASLDLIRPRAASDLESAMSVDRGLIGETAGGRTAAAIRAMQLEAEMRDSPTLRADVFVRRWQGLERQRRLLIADHENTRADKVADTMIGMAKSLERDPQIESILRIRKGELGLPAMPERSVGQALADMIGRGRNRGIEIGM